METISDSLAPEEAQWIHARAVAGVRMLDHEVDLVTIDRFTVSFDEEILSTDRFEARFTFTIDGDALTLTVDDDVWVVDVTEHV